MTAQVDQPTYPNPAAHTSSPPDPGRDATDREMLLWAVVVGVVGGLLALAYYFLLTGLMHFVWSTLGGMEWLKLSPVPGFYPFILLASTSGGFLVGLALKRLGTPGEIAAVVDNIHLERGRLDYRQTPSMVTASLISITAGGSAGPEAPLVQIIGSFGSWLGDSLKLQGHLVRILTLCGMSTALGAFFGAPLGGALFALEIPHRRGLEYYEALIPSVLSALIGFAVFKSVLGYDGAIYHLPRLADHELSLVTVFYGLVLGLFGGLVALVFTWQFTAIGHFAHRLAAHKVKLATLGGLLVGLLAQVAPLTLFWGEYQIEGVILHSETVVRDHGVPLAIGLLGLIAILKMLAISCTLHSGFRGGFIFPLFFIGATLGLAVSLAFPQVPLAVAVLCLMAAVNVAVTKTPISTTVILTSLSGTSMLPVIVTASFASFLLTTRLSLIHSQRPRFPHPVSLPATIRSKNDELAAPT